MKNTKIEVTHWNNKEKPHYTCEYDTKNFTVMKTKPICADVPKYICTSNWKVHPIKGKVSKERDIYEKHNVTPNASQCFPGFSNPNQKVHGLFHFYIAGICKTDQNEKTICHWASKIHFYRHG